MNPLTEGNVSKSGHEWLEKVNREGVSKHTLGPWHITQTELWSDRPYSFGVTVAADQHKHCHMEANANLIAAAPDLLEALDRLTKWAEVMAEAQTCEHTGDHPIAVARAALIKALTGESK